MVVQAIVAQGFRLSRSGGIRESDHLGVCSPSLSHADRAFGSADHWPAMADHHELGLFGLARNQSGQTLHVDAVQEAVDLIEGIERRRAEPL